MRNPCTILRFALFAFLFYLNILAMAFAAWNLTALRSVNISANGGPIFVTFNSCCIIIYLAMSLSELVFPRFWSPKVMLECMWIVAFGILQLAAAIDVTINGPGVTCQFPAVTINANACASSSLLVAISWVSGSMLLFYVFALVGITATHVGTYAGIWLMPVTSVAWFAEFPSDPSPAYSPSPVSLSSMKKTKPADVECPYENPVFRGVTPATTPTPSINDASETLLSPGTLLVPPSPGSKHTSYRASFESRLSLLRGFTISAPFSKGVETVLPSWAKALDSRRGVDPPFVASPPADRPVRMKSHWSATTTASSCAPPLPPKARAVPGRAQHGRAGEREYDVEVLSQVSSALPVIMPSPSRPISYGIFPEYMPDPDLPIKTTHRSEWIAANMNKNARGASGAQRQYSGHAF